MKSKRSLSKKKPPTASGIPIYCAHDAIVAARDLILWGEQKGSKNPKKHPPAQLDRYETVVKGNGYRRAAVVSRRSGAVTKGNGLVQMARRQGWDVPVEYQDYANRAEEIRDVAADNTLAELAVTDDEALRQMLSELDPGEIQFTATSEEEFRRLVEEAAGDVEAEFPITAKLHEAYDYVLIFTTNDTEFAFLQNLLGVAPERSYKKTGVGIGRAIPLARAIAALRANRHSIDVQSGHNDHPQAAAKRTRVRAGKPTAGIRQSRPS